MRGHRTPSISRAYIPTHKGMGFYARLIKLTFFEMVKIQGRGSNSRSHHNKPRVKGEPTKIILSDEDKAIAKALGETIAEGVRIALRTHSLTYPDTMPVPRQLLTLLLRVQKRLATDEEIETAIAHLESWGVEADYSEALTEGAIKAGDNWIV